MKIFVLGSNNQEKQVSAGIITVLETLVNSQQNAWVEFDFSNINSFRATDLFLYFLKTSEKL